MQLALRLDVLHGPMQVLLPLGKFTWFGRGNNSMRVAMVPELPSRTLGQGPFSCRGSTFRGTQHPLCLLQTFFACFALLIMIGASILPQCGMCDTCIVTVTACWIKCWKSILLLSLAGTVAKAAPGSCINQEGLEQITAK